METAVTLPDELVAAAEKAAAELAMSRDEYFAAALAEYLLRHGDDPVTRSLNEVYATESNQLDPALASAQSAVVRRQDW